MSEYKNLYRYFILDQDKKIKCVNYETFKEWNNEQYKKNPDFMIVKKTKINKFEISTILVPTDHKPLDSDEQLFPFETIVFNEEPGKTTEPIKWFSYHQAVSAHEHIEEILQKETE